MSSVMGRGPSVLVGLRVAEQHDGRARRPWRGGDGPQERASARTVPIVLRGRREVDEPPPSRGAPAAVFRVAAYRADSLSPAALRDCAEGHGAPAAEHQARSPTNVCLNHYDGGRDLDATHSLSLTFGSREGRVVRCSRRAQGWARVRVRSGCSLVGVAQRADVGERRRVCVVVASRANLARITTVLEGVRDHPALELQVIASAWALLERFGSAVDVLADAGFRPDAKIRLIVEGQTPATMAKSTGLGLLELPTRQPDHRTRPGEAF